MWASWGARVAHAEPTFPPHQPTSVPHVEPTVWRSRGEQHESGVVVVSVYRRSPLVVFVVEEGGGPTTTVPTSPAADAILQLAQRRLLQLLTP